MDFLQSIDWRGIGWAAIVLRVLLAVLIGGLLGVEREMKRHPAGFRTYIIVCLGAAMVMMTNQYILKIVGSGDPTRLGAQVISGIGFLGAGTIIVTSRSQVKGLTTAASLWTVACLGLAIGSGFYEGAVVGGVAVFLIMFVFQKIDDWVALNNRFIRLMATFGSVADIDAFKHQCGEWGVKIKSIEMTKGKAKNGGILMLLMLELPRPGQHKDVLDRLSGLECVRQFTEL
ncbi:MAG: MgtC/SapB family protein [Lachnospiraceae bacterium]|jgi:putative Mg2+ transporter-C (MgtC) family protein|nr:MgtC/SapB family protein [Lachnospiraceae bacterium]